MCLSLCQARKVYSVCLSDHVKKTKSTDLESISLSLECKGGIQNPSWEPYISSWTNSDAFTEVTRQAILPFKNPPVFRIWMCLHICTQWQVQIIPIAVIHVPSKPKSHPDEAPYKRSRFLADNTCLICFSKLFSVGPCVRIILSLQINRIIALTFQIRLLSWE